jgi:DNA-binding NarL/FixJ family response regulator
MPRVAIVAASAAQRERLRSLLRGPDIELVGDAPSLDADVLDRADVVVVAGEQLLAQALDWADTDSHLAVVGLVADGAPPAGWPVGGSDPEASSHPAAVRGWALLADDADARALHAALVAADAGLAVWPASWAPRAAAPDVTPVFADAEDVYGAETLTPREQDVLELLSIGLSNRSIAERLGISGHTVKFHVAAIYGKLGVSGRTAAVNRALRRGILKI